MEPQGGRHTKVILCQVVIHTRHPFNPSMPNSNCSGQHYLPHDNLNRDYCERLQRLQETQKKKKQQNTFDFVHLMRSHQISHLSTTPVTSTRTNHRHRRLRVLQNRLRHPFRRIHGEKQCDVAARLGRIDNYSR